MVLKIMKCLLVTASIITIAESVDETRFINVPGYRLEFQSITSFSVQNKLMCNRACEKNSNCNSVNLNVISDAEIECELHSLSLNDTAILREDEHGEFSCKN